MNTELHILPLSHLVVSQTPMQIERRKHRTEQDIKDLADSMASVGQIHPIVVRPNPFPDFCKSKDGAPLYEIVAGEGRFLGAQLADLTEIRAEVRDLTDEQVEEIQLIENLQRTGLHELVEAEGYEALQKRGHSVEEIAARTGKSKGTVYARVKLLALCPDARTALREGKVTASIALLIARLPDERSQKDALKEVTTPDYAGEPMTYREAAEYIQREYTCRLDQCGFDTSDTTLVPSAGACVDCPKRSGNQPELFSDIQRADICTDHLCLKSKRDAHAALLIKTAKAEGRKVIAGADAKKAVAFENEHTVSLMSTYARPEDTCHDDGRHRTWAQLINAAEELYPEARRPKLLKTPGGKIIEVFERAETLAKLKKAGVLEKAESSYSPKSRTVTAPKVDPKIEIEKTVRARVFRAVFEKAPTKMSRKLIEERILDEINMGVVDLMDLCGALGWDDFNMDHPARELAKLKEADVYRLLNVLSLADDLSPYGQATRLMDAAKEARIDVAKIRKAVADEEKVAKSAAAPAKASKKKAARKAK